MLGSGSLMAQSMSDSQVLEYVKDGIRQGKEQKQLASELARKGVTKEQAMRVKQLYEQQNNVNTSKSTGTDINESRLREETKENTSDMLERHPFAGVLERRTDTLFALLHGIVRQSHKVETQTAARDVDLDGHRHSVDPDNCPCISANEHGQKGASSLRFAERLTSNSPPIAAPSPATGALFDPLA